MVCAVTSLDTPRLMPRRVKQMADGSAVGQIGIHDPFELVRHLARSQSDPRKAIAELVQNALDEQATHIVIERKKIDGESALSLLDDGLGVLPHLPRKDALTSIATNIGHSRKKQLTFDERMRAAMLGQYGIGLLGFWAVGHELRIISQVQGGEVWALTLFEDSPRYTVTRLPEVLGRSATWTEVQVLRLHRSAIAPTVGARLAAYLSVELRGQLMRHGTAISLFDRLARGGADRHLTIEPSTLAGERLPGLEPVVVEGFEHPIDVVLHYAGDAGPDAGRVRLASAGAVVIDDIATLPELAHEPWTDSRLVGVVDFPHLEVPPGSRRGVVPNEAFSAMVAALVQLEPMVADRLHDRSRAEASALSNDMHKQLARLFTKVTTFVPHLAWFPVQRKGGQVEEAGEGTAVPESKPERDEPTEPSAPRDEQPELFPPGPVQSVRVRPSKLEVAVGEPNRLRATALDENDRAIAEGVTFEWKAKGALTVEANGSTASVVGTAVDAEALIEVTAQQADRTRSYTVPVKIVLELPRRADTGIPQPEEIDEPLQSWRSRLTDERWQINVGHPDYRALSSEARPRLRYLATLLSKEVVSRNFPQPGVGGILEELVGLLSALERSGAWSGRIREDAATSAPDS